MGKIDYKSIYETNKNDWRALTNDPQKYEALLAGHYSDSNHFIYELLQNAEDAFETDSAGFFDPSTCAHASKVFIEYYRDKLVFYHNGKPFDEGDVRGVSSMLMGTKDRDDAQTIGRFGMGFKSVFKYTYQPEIYSDDEAFMITSYLLPVEIKYGWNYETERRNVTCKLSKNRSVTPFYSDSHLTKIVIPFLKYDRKGALSHVPGDDVLKKLKDLNGEILLFLTHIKHLYWIDKTTGRFAYITKEIDAEDEHHIICRMESTVFGDKTEVSHYYLFKKVFDHSDMKNAEVSVAYKLNARGDNVNEVKKAPIWVYFPTRDETELPFIIHGSFETAVSREKLMVPSSFNDDLFDKLGTLIAESMKELAKKNLITQMFIRKILIPAFDDEDKNGTIVGLKNKVTKIFRRHPLLPSRSGEYRLPDNLLVPVPFQIGAFTNNRLLSKALTKKEFVIFNNDQETKFIDYYVWLTVDLGIPIYKLSDFANDLTVIADCRIPSVGDSFDALQEFYKFLFDYREAVYATGLSYSRSGAYEAAIRNDIGFAWIKLRQIPIILNNTNQLSPAYANDKPVIYLGSSSQYKNLMQSSLVHKTIAQSFTQLLSEGFRIPEYNNLQYVKESVIPKYADNEERIEFANSDNYESEYAEDIQLIIKLLEESGNTEEIVNLLAKASIIKVKPDSPDDDFGTFDNPGVCYVPESDEGINLDIYFAPVLYEDVDEEDIDDEDSWYNFDLYPIDVDFYNSHGIPISKLKKLGLITTPVIEGIREDTRYTGYYYWKALGEHCPKMEITGLEDNLYYISEHPNLKNAKEKSAEIFKLLLKHSNKMIGKIRRQKVKTIEEDSVVDFLSNVKTIPWLFDKAMNLFAPCKLSKYDLNQELYDINSANRRAFEVLGFIEKSIDGTEDTLQRARSLDNQGKRRLLDVLAKDLGVKVTSGASDDDWGDDDSELEFNPNSYVDDEFPVRKIINIDYLVRHVQEQFYCADTTKYEMVLRRIRLSKNSKADNAYAEGMYTNTSNVTICQRCKKPTETPWVNQISNFGIEMSQLNLCFCPNCSGEYKQICNKKGFKEEITEKILSADTSPNLDEYSISINSNFKIYFTQTHIAELQIILKLLSEFGVPDSHKNRDNISSVESTPKKVGVEKARDPIFMADVVEKPINKPTNISKAPSNTMIKQDKWKGYVPPATQNRGRSFDVIGDRSTSEKKDKKSEKLCFESFKIGSRILHNTIGKGTVIARSNGKITVKFDKGITQDLNVAFCLEKNLLELI